MACSLSTIQAEACLSGIGKEQSRIKLLQWIAQLTCEAAEAAGGGGGATAFTQLTDVPNSYVGSGGFGVRVNAGATGLEFYSLAAGTVTKFASANIALDGVSTAYTVAHGLGATPPQKDVGLICIGNDAATGYLIGDVVDHSAWFSSANLVPAFAVTKNATNVIVSLPGSTLVGSEGDYVVNSRDGNALIQPTSFNNFALKIYAWL